VSIYDYMVKCGFFDSDHWVVSINSMKGQNKVYRLLCAMRTLGIL